MNARVLATFTVSGISTLQEERYLEGELQQGGQRDLHLTVRSVVERMDDSLANGPLDPNRRIVTRSYVGIERDDQAGLAHLAYMAPIQGHKLAADMIRRVVAREEG